MLPGLEALACPDMAVPMDVMQHVVNVESSRNPYAIGVVGGALVRQPRHQEEAVATARMLEEKGYNFSVGLAQVNRYNLAKYGLDSYELAFQQCPNLQAGARILSECYGRSGNDWGKAFSCYYSGNFETGFRHGYVQKVFKSIERSQKGTAGGVGPIPLVEPALPHNGSNTDGTSSSVVDRRMSRVDELRALPHGATVRASMVEPGGRQFQRGAAHAMDAAVARRVADNAPRFAAASQAPSAMQQVPPVAALGSTAQMAYQDTAGPVVLKPWGASPAQGVAPPAASVSSIEIPAGDAAFVF